LIHHDSRVVFDPGVPVECLRAQVKSRIEILRAHIGEIDQVVHDVARSAIGISKDGATLVLFTVDVRGGSAGMASRVWSSSTMASMRVPVTLSDKGNGLYEGSGLLENGGTWQVTILAKKNGQPIATKQLTVNATGGM